MRPLRSLCLIAALAASGTFAATATPAHADNMAIAYVDVERIVADCDEGREAAEQLKREQAKRQSEIGARETDLKRMQDDLERQAKAFSKEALEKKAMVYQQFLAEYQALVVKFNKDLQSKERELFDPIDLRLRELLRTIALREGYDLILSKRSVPYGRKDLDLTERVTQEYNRAYPVTKKAKEEKPKGKGKDAAKPAKPEPKK